MAAAYAELAGRARTLVETPRVVLLGGLLAAEGVRFVIVGSAALWLHGFDLSVGDLDIVPDLDDTNLTLLRNSLGVYQPAAMARPVPPRLLNLGVWSIETVFGHVDVLMERARVEGPGLREQACAVPVVDVEVTIAWSSDAWALRHRFKTSDDVVGVR